MEICPSLFVPSTMPPGIITSDLITQRLYKKPLRVELAMRTRASITGTRSVHRPQANVPDDRPKRDRYGN